MQIAFNLHKKFQQNYYYLSRNTLLNEMFKTAPENRTAT